MGNTFTLALRRLHIHERRALLERLVERAMRKITQVYPCNPCYDNIWFSRSQW